MVDNTIKKEFLKSHSLFGGLTDTELEEISHYFHIEEYQEGAFILHESEPNSKLFFILEGSVSILKEQGNCGASNNLSNHENCIELSHMQAGDTFGEMELIDIQPCAATVRADEKTSVVTFTNADLYKLSKWNLKTYAMIIMNLAREISRRLRAANEAFSLKNSPEKEH